MGGRELDADEHRNHDLERETLILFTEELAGLMPEERKEPTTMMETILCITLADNHEKAAELDNLTDRTISLPPVKVGQFLTLLWSENEWEMIVTEVTWDINLDDMTATQFVTLVSVEA